METLGELGRGEEREGEEESGGEERGEEEKRREGGEQRETEGEAGLKFRIVGGLVGRLIKRRELVLLL